jgi:FtsP/CotA-like multicopper oxidase with cupredoxin domain
MNRLSRRRFLATGAITGILAPCARASHAHPGSTQLRVTRRVIEVNGKAANVFGLIHRDGRHGIVADAGQRFHVQLLNELDEHTLVHWHGLTPPSDQDGVPELSQPSLKAGSDYEYDFALARPGTNWMHSHVGLQEQQLLAAPLIVRDPAEAGRDEQEVVALLHDFTFRDPAEILAGLSGGMGGAGDSEGMAGMDHSAMGSGAMADVQPHLNDIEFDAYLANDRTLGDPQTVRVEAGGRVRLRIINAASSTNFWLDLGALAGDLVAVDGHAIAPLSGSRFPLAIAQRADIRLRLPAGVGAYPILAVREGDTARTGIILATAGAAIARIPGRAETPTGALDLGLERRLAAVDDSLAGNADRPVRRHVLDLTGSMMGFVWGFNGRHFGEDTPLAVRQGERVEIRLVNRTDMSHPIHLHGHPFQVIAIDDGAFAGAVRDTVLVPAGASVTIAFAADNPGHWAFHCHNLYHMAAGMMTSVQYET